jgi:hypothetical protein
VTVATDVLKWANRNEEVTKEVDLKGTFVPRFSKPHLHLTNEYCGYSRSASGETKLVIGDEVRTGPLSELIKEGDLDASVVLVLTYIEENWGS